MIRPKSGTANFLSYKNVKLDSIIYYDKINRSWFNLLAKIKPYSAGIGSYTTHILMYYMVQT